MPILAASEPTTVAAYPAISLTRVVVCGWHLSESPRWASGRGRCAPARRPSGPAKWRRVSDRRTRSRGGGVGHKHAKGIYLAHRPITVPQ
eukprot:1177119-Prorocentrum_minimum.AAC.1